MSDDRPRVRFWSLYTGESNADRSPRFGRPPADPQYVPDQVTRDSYFAAALHGLTEEVAAAPEGTRNDTLNRLAYVAYRKAQTCLQPLEGVTDAMAESATRAGLDRIEIDKTLLSAISAANRDGPWPVDWQDYATTGSVTIDPGQLRGGDCPEFRSADKESGVGDSTSALGAELLSRSALNQLPKAEPLIGNVLDQGTVALLYGRWGSGKSFIALDWAASVATGRAWQSRPTEQRRVLYVAAEGAYGLRARLDAWEQGWKTTVEDGQMEILPRPLNLTNAFEVSSLAALIAWNGYGLVLFDTLARCMVGADENSAKDCGQVVDAMHRLREATPDGRGVVTAVHHTGKDGRTFRGSSVFEAGADTVYAVNLDGQVVTLKREKRKDGPQDDQHSLKLDPIPGTDSCVMSIHRGADTSGAAARLMSVFLSVFDSMGCSRADLRSAAEMPPSSFHRALSELLRSGELINTGTDKRPFLMRSDV